MSEEKILRFDNKNGYIVEVIFGYEEKTLTTIKRKIFRGDVVVFKEIYDKEEDYERFQTALKEELQYMESVVKLKRTLTQEFEENREESQENKQGRKKRGKKIRRLEATAEFLRTGKWNP